MDKYVLLRFAHLIGLMLMSAGLIGVFVADMRSRQVRDVKLLAQAVCDRHRACGGRGVLAELLHSAPLPLGWRRVTGRLSATPKR